ncbi:hypothetical protein K456DRAFT_54911, partial [Colletotrichum gloeosporioides 23]
MKAVLFCYSLCPGCLLLFLLFFVQMHNHDAMHRCEDTVFAQHGIAFATYL